MKLTDPTLDELDCAFAECVAGREIIGLARMWVRVGISSHEPIPRFTRSFDAVLPWLEKGRENGRRVGCEMGLKRWRIWIYDKQPSGMYLTSDRPPDGDAETFPLAVVIALLRAHGHEVTFTK